MFDAFETWGPAEFGPSRVAASSLPPPLCLIERRRRDGIEAAVREECPQTPGVYGMLDRSGAWIYVGKSKRLRTRLLCYFRAKSRAAKERRILDRTKALAWEILPNEFAALLRELELIQRFRPRFNVLGQPDARDYIYLCIGKSPAPHAYLAYSPPANAVSWHGPIPNTTRAREAVRRLNDCFGLRDCPRRVELAFSNRPHLFPILTSPGCMRWELRTCLGPCIAHCSETKYAKQVRAARAFLTGEDPTPITQMRSQMAEASAALEFERAAEIHERLQSLEWLLEQLGRLRFAKGEYSFIYPVQSAGGIVGETKKRKTVWYLIHGGLVVRAMSAPDARSKLDYETQISQTFSRPPVSAGPPDIHESDMLALVAGWFRRNPEELAKTLRPEDAIRLAEKVDARKPRTRDA